MTTEEYLNQVYKLDNKIKLMKMRSEEYDRLSLSIPGPNYGNDMPRNPNRNLDAPFLKWIIKKDEIDREIAALEEKLKALKAEIAMKIEELPSEELKNLAIMRYFKYMKWMEIAKNLYVSKATVYRLRDKVIELIKVETQ